MQLYSYQHVIAPNTTTRIIGDPNRTVFIMKVEGEQTFDMALVPRGHDPTGHWIDGWTATDRQEIQHSGDIYFKDNDNVGDETIRMASDTPIVFEVI